MKKLQLIKMTINGFRAFETPATFNFDRICTISGDNGEGKTSIAEAFAYALTGRTFFGDAKNNDQLINTNCKKLMVELEFRDEEGRLHKLTRNRSDYSSTLILDDFTIRQSIIENMYGNRNVVLSIINPLYFIERLADSDGRDFLMQLLPQVDDETVKSSLCETHKAALKDQNIPDPSYYLKLKREEKRKAEETLTYLQGKLDYLNVQLNSTSCKQDVDFVNDRIDELYVTLSDIDKARPEPTDKSALLKQKSELEKEIVRLNLAKPDAIDVSKLEQQKAEMVNRPLHVKVRFKRTLTIK